MQSFFNLSEKAKLEFYQSKYNYYKRFNLGTLTASSFIYLLLFIADWQMYGYLFDLSLFLRSLIFIPLILFVFIYRKTNDYKIMTILSFIMVHLMIWGNIFITAYLPDKSFFNEGFLIMNFILILTSFSAPPFTAILSQIALIGDIFLANYLFHLDQLRIILTFNILIVIILCLIDLITTQYYYDHYTTEKKLEFALIHDPLTKVFNRRKLDELMGTAHDISFMSDQIAILIMNADHFKYVNDAFGHDEGDRVLQFVADCIRNNLRGQDLIIRWAGDEFVAILFDCPQDKISLVAERIRYSVESSINGVCRVTISIGFAVYEGGDCLNTIKNADLALQQAKQTGRNKAVDFKIIEEINAIPN